MRTRCITTFALYDNQPAMYLLCDGNCFTRARLVESGEKKWIIEACDDYRVSKSAVPEGMFLTTDIDLVNKIFKIVSENRYN